jgi:hypothetical protein
LESALTVHILSGVSDPVVLFVVYCNIIQRVHNKRLIILWIPALFILGYEWREIE